MHYFGSDVDLLPDSGNTKGFNVGSKDIGNFVSANIELAYQESTNGDPFCISQIGWKNNIDGTGKTIYGTQYFGDGVYLAGQSSVDAYNFKVSPYDETLYLQMTQDQYVMSLLQKSTNIRLLIHVCYEAYDNNGDFSTLSSNLFVSVTGKTAEGIFESSDSLQLSTVNDDFAHNTFRTYSFMVNHEFVEISFVTITNSETDMVCIDEVQINDQKAYLSNHFIASSASDCEGHGNTCSEQLNAVLSWYLFYLYVFCVPSV